VGAVSENQILGLYSERKPAASGGVWDRLSAVQTLEWALASSEPEELAGAIAPMWQLLEESSLEVPFAQIFGKDLATREIPGEAGQIAFRLWLLSDHYEEVANATTSTPENREATFLKGLARGDMSNTTPFDARSQTVQDAFAATEIPVRLRSLVEQERLGEAILRTIALFNAGAHGDLDEVKDALSFFRLVGLEEVARRAALEYLILAHGGFLRSSSFTALPMKRAGARTTLPSRSRDRDARNPCQRPLVKPKLMQF